MKSSSSEKTPRPREEVVSTGTYREMARKLPAAQRPMLDPIGPPGTASDTELRILLPEPHALLHAHNKGSWHSKSSVVKLLRWKAKKRCLDCCAASWPAATVQYLFYLPDRPFMRDEANLIQSQKPAIDGVVDAKVIPDDSIRYLHIAGIWCGTDQDNPRTELVFRRATVKQLATMRNRIRDSGFQR